MLFKDSPPVCKALQMYYKMFYLQRNLQKLLTRMEMRQRKKKEGLEWLSSASYNYQQEIDIQDLVSVREQNTQNL